MWYSSRMPDTPDRKTTRRIASLENKIKYWRRYVADQRASIHSQFDKRNVERMKPAQVEHWTKVRDAALDRVDELEASKIAPMEAEYRQLMGLD